VNSSRFRAFYFAVGVPNRSFHFTTDIETPPVSFTRSDQPVTILSFIVGDTVPVFHIIESISISFSIDNFVADSTGFRSFNFSIGTFDRALHFTTDMDSSPVSLSTTDQPVAVLSFIVGDTIPVSPQIESVPISSTVHDFDSDFTGA